MDFFKRKVFTRPSSPPVDSDSDKERPFNLNSLPTTPSGTSSREQSGSPKTPSNRALNQDDIRNRSSSLLVPRNHSNLSALTKSYDAGFTVGIDTSPARVLVGKVKKKVGSSPYKQKRPSTAGIDRVTPSFMEGKGRFDSLDNQRASPSKYYSSASATSSASSNQQDEQNMSYQELLNSPLPPSSDHSNDPPVGSSTFPRKKSSVQSLGKNLKNALIPDSTTSTSPSSDLPFGSASLGHSKTHVRKKGSIGKMREVKNSITMSGGKKREKEVKEENRFKDGDSSTPTQVGGKVVRRKRSKSTLLANHFEEDSSKFDGSKSKSVDTTHTITISRSRNNSFGAPIIEKVPVFKDSVPSLASSRSTSSNSRYASPNLDQASLVPSQSDSNSFSEPIASDANKDQIEIGVSSSGPKSRASLPQLPVKPTQAVEYEEIKNRDRAATTSAIPTPKFKEFKVLSPQDFRRKRFTAEEMNPVNRRLSRASSKASSSQINSPSEYKNLFSLLAQRLRLT